MNQKLNNFFKVLGPGIMFAGTCIGGSHLVQSTRAGASYGFELLYIILLANFLKYPFFEYASRYTNATGDSILEGYSQIGKWAIGLYTAITFITMFIVTAAIILVAGGLLGNLFNSTPENVFYWVLGLGAIVWLLLMSGKFSLLDEAMKVIGLILVVSVVTSTVAVFTDDVPYTPQDTTPYNALGFSFIIALMGWMPMGVDMSAWTSLWTQERIKQTNYHPKLKETLLDFNIGYGITVVLALCFLTLGAFIMHGTNQTLSNSGILFSRQLVNMFTASIGPWSYIIIATAAFSTMFGTSLTLVDGYARSIDRSTQLLNFTSKSKLKTWITIIMIGGLIVVAYSILIKDQEGNPILNFKKLIDIATATSFLVAPIAGYLNYRIMNDKKIPETHQPPKWLNILSIIGLVFLTGFSIAYLTTFF